MTTTATDSVDDSTSAAEAAVVTVVCGRCGDDRTVEPSRSQRTADDVLEELFAAGWTVSGDRLWCPACALRAVCETTRHHWGRWTRIGPSLTDGSPGGRCRHCLVCTAGEFDMDPATA